MTARWRVVAAAVAVLLVASAAWLFWDSSSRRAGERAGDAATQAARDAVVAMLTYRPDTVEKDFDAAREHMTGRFLDDYTQLAKTVVIPEAKGRSVSSTATVPATAVVSATDDRVLVLAYVDQTTTTGTEKPATAASAARVTMEKVDGRWLVAAFEPI